MNKSLAENHFRWLTSPALLMQIFRFGIIGLLAASMHFSIVVAIVQNVAMAPLKANCFAFLVSFQISYWGHRLWTFQNSDALHRVAFSKLLLVQFINFIANESLFAIFLSLQLPYPIALIIVITILPIFTFIMSKRWVFR